MIFTIIAIGVAKRFGSTMLSIAFPVAFLSEHVYVFPYVIMRGFLLPAAGRFP